MYFELATVNSELILNPVEALRSGVIGATAILEMLSRTRNIFKLVSSPRNILWARSYHSYPDPTEKPQVTVNKSQVTKTINKDSPSFKLADKFKLEKVFPGTPVNGGIGKTSPPPTLVTKLSNGLSVATQEMPGLMSSFALIVRSGSSYEKQGGEYDETGLTHFLELNAFRTSKNRTHSDVGVNSQFHYFTYCLCSL